MSGAGDQAHTPYSQLISSMDKSSGVHTGVNMLRYAYERRLDGTIECSWSILEMLPVPLLPHGAQEGQLLSGLSCPSVVNTRDRCLFCPWLTSNLPTRPPFRTEPICNRASVTESRGKDSDRGIDIRVFHTRDLRPYLILAMVSGLVMSRAQGPMGRQPSSGPWHRCHESHLRPREMKCRFGYCKYSGKVLCQTAVTTAIRKNDVPVQSGGEVCSTCRYGWVTI